MQVHYDEGVATRIGPESCAGGREATREALTGERIGQPLSRDSFLIPDADAVINVEGNTDGRVIASAWTIRRGRRPWHVQTLLARGNREISGPTVRQSGGTLPAWCRRSASGR